jgi:hypothetical protein
MLFSSAFADTLSQVVATAVPRVLQVSQSASSSNCFYCAHRAVATSFIEFHAVSAFLLYLANFAIS